MQTQKLVLMLSLPLLAPLGCDDVDAPELPSTEVLRGSADTDLCDEIGILRDGLVGISADPVLAALAQETAREAGENAVPFSELRAAAEARGLDIDADIEAGVLRRNGSDQDVVRALTLFAEIEDGLLLHSAELDLKGELLGGDGTDVPPTWLVSSPIIGGSGCGDENQRAKEQTWSEFCGDMGLNVCYEQPFYYCCGSSTL